MTLLLVKKSIYKLISIIIQPLQGMPKKLSTREIRKKDQAHPKSRKSQQIQRSLLRKDRLGRRKQERTKTRFHPLVDRLTWFQLAIDPAEESLTASKIHQLVSEYLGRFDAEVAGLQASLRPGRPRPLRLDELEMVQRLEAEEYSSGSFEVPLMTTSAGLAALLRWDGLYDSISQVPMTKIKKIEN